MQNDCKTVNDWYRAVLRLNLFFGKFFTNMLTSSYIQVSNTFSIIGLIAESILKFINDIRIKIFRNSIRSLGIIRSKSDSLNLKHS